MADNAENQEAGTAASNDDAATKEARSTESVLAEMNRKHEKQMQETQALNAKLEQLTNQIAQQRNQPKPSPGGSFEDLTDEQLEELSYKDPKAYARAVKAQASSEASRIVHTAMNHQNQSQMVMGQLIGEYPELGDTTSELSQKAVAHYNSLSPQQRQDPMAYKLAVREAAADVGILPKSKRTKNDDGSFTVGGSKGNAPPRKKESDDVDQRTVEMARLLGVKTEDPKVMARLKQRAQRKNWGKYE